MTSRVLKYNPALLSDEELRANFVVRQTDLAQIVRVIQDNTTDTGNPNQHVLVIGPRGSGKTTLVLRVALEIRQTPELNQGWYPLRFPEESYEVASPGEFWLEALYHLAEQTGETRWRQTHATLKEETDEDRLRERALGQLLDFADSQRKKILLIVENMNMLFNDQLDDDHAWKIRHTLMHEPRLMLLGTATHRFDEIEKADKAFYELFKRHQVPVLSDEECNVVWEKVAGKKLEGEQIRPIHILTGGNLRLLTIIAKFGGKHSFHQLLDELVNLVDEHTEYFKSHLDNLAAMERKVYLALADLWDPSPAREIARAARLDTSKTSAFLKRLCERGAVSVLPKGKGRLYMLAERMYNIYYLMRRSGTGRIKATVNFMIGMYGEKSAARLMSREAGNLTPEEKRAIYEEITSRFGASTFSDAIQNFEDLEEVRIERAKASFNLITNYGKAGNLAEARVLFDAMQECGNSEEVQVLRAKAAFNLIFDYGNARKLEETRPLFEVYLANAGVVENTAEYSINIFVALAASGHAQEVLQMLECSEGKKYLEPLLAGLKLYLGEKVWVAQEVYEVAKDVKKRIENFPQTPIAQISSKASS